jgi:signal transduction histidine kinase
MLSFAALTVYSIALHRGTVAKVGIINSSYLPLTLGVSEMHATQKVFNTMMDRLPDDPNQRVTRDWIDAARRYRPSTLRHLLSLIDRTLNERISQNEASFLVEVKKRLSKVSRRYAQNESGFTKLYSLMNTGRTDEARVHVEGLKRVERSLDRILFNIGEEVSQHITDLAEEAEYDGYRATWGLGLLTAAALLIAVILIVSTNRLLVPLKSMLRSVAKVAGGDLNTRVKIDRHDEIGALAAGFNKMIEALAERDHNLIRSERLATAGKMAAQVTHEIRNPLSSLGLNAELLEEELAKGSDKSEARSLVKAIQDEIGRLTGITESYLRFARLPPPEPKFDDLNAVVTAAVEFMKSEMAGEKISVETDLAPDLGLLLFDRGQIRQALVNLFRNSCEAMPNGGKIRASTRSVGDTVELEVSDEGHGIPEDALDQIFEAFYSLKSGGTGLGLPLVRQICSAHGGSVRCRETGSSGTAFVIALPKIQAADGNKEKQT